MITKLRFIQDSNSFSYSASEGTCRIELKSIVANSITNGIRLSMPVQTVDIKAQQGISSIQKNGLFTINQIGPNPTDGNFNILGSLCTSIVDNTDTSDEESAPSDSHILNIYDGCVPCNICATIAWLQDQIQRLSIVLKGIKDNNLYTQEEAVGRWGAMTSALSWDSLELPASCRKKQNLISLQRSEKADFATKLLFQYKATVAMWNYLVRRRTTHVQIVQAPEDYGGFVVQVKKTLNTCGITDTTTVSLGITIDLQKGQDQAFLLSNSLGMGVYVGKVDQNCYIQYNKDSGMRTLTNIQPEQDITLEVQEAALISGAGAHIKALFQFALQQPAQTVLSVALKVIPFVYIPGDKREILDQNGQLVQYTAPSTIFTYCQELKDWITHRKQATTLQDALQTGRNTWRVGIEWFLPQGMEPESAEDRYSTLYYRTAYSKYPIKEKVQEQSQENTQV